MRPVRLPSDLRREQIIDAAKRCFARHGYAGTTTRSVAAAAGISEGLLFKHFPTKAALYAEILADACETDPDLLELQALEPSTATLAVLIRKMVAHFMQASNSPDHEEVQKLKLVVSSHLEGGEFARLLFEKIGHIIEPIFEASLARAIAAGDATPSGTPARNQFWFMHQALLMLTLTRLPAMPTISFSDAVALERQVCEFALRSIGVTNDAIARLLDQDAPSSTPILATESA